VLTRLGGHTFALNQDLIERADATPDTVVTLVDGTKYVISESLTELVELIRAFRASVITEAQQFDRQPALRSVRRPEPTRAEPTHPEPPRAEPTHPERRVEPLHADPARPHPTRPEPGRGPRPEPGRGPRPEPGRGPGDGGSGRAETAQPTAAVLPLHRREP
jgi:flagellar protein FlbD